MCPSCSKPLNAQGLCTNVLCERYPRCQKHNEAVLVVGKDRCRQCIQEEQAAARRLQARASFQQLPHFLTEPVKWLNDNKLELSVPANTGAAGEEELTVSGHKYPWKKVVGAARLRRVHFEYDAQRKRADLVLNDNQGMEAFFLPWRSDAFYSMTLGPEANLFVTAKMNGCCVMIGGSQHSPTVFHVNFKDQIPEATVERAKSVQNPAYTRLYGAALKLLQGRHLLDSPVQVFDPAFYMAENAGRRGIVWGRRHSVHGWKFFYQMDLLVPVEVPWNVPFTFGYVQWGHQGQWVSKWQPRQAVPHAGELWPRRS